PEASRFFFARVAMRPVKRAGMSDRVIPGAGGSVSPVSKNWPAVDPAGLFADLIDHGSPATSISHLAHHRVPAAGYRGAHAGMGGDGSVDRDWRRCTANRSEPGTAAA